MIAIDLLIHEKKKYRISVACFFFISGFGFASWACRIPALQQQLQLNNAALGSTLFALPLGLMLTLPLTSYLLGKYSSRYIMLLGTIFYTILLCILGFVTNIWQFVILLFLFGGSRNLMNISINAQSVGVQKMYQKSIISTFHGIWSISGFAGAAFGAILIGQEIATWLHFIIAAIICLITAAFSFKYTLPNDVQKNSSTTKQLLFNLPDKSLLNLGLIGFACMACEGIMYDWSGVYFKTIIHAPKTFETLGYIGYMCAAAGGRFIGDWLTNKLGEKKLLQLSGLFIFMGMLLSIIFPYLITATIGFICIGLGASCIIPITMSIAGKSTNKTAGVAIASISTVSYLGFLLFPPIIGYIAETIGLQYSFCLGAFMALVIVWIVSKMKTQQ
ncbi:MAG: MFS transporter [Chitinophagaceae bacterium]